MSISRSLTSLRTQSAIILHHPNSPRSDLSSRIIRIFLRQETRETTGDIILFLDDDTEVLPGCISAHLSIHRTTQSAIVAGRSIMTGSIPWAAIAEPALINPRTGETLANFDLPTSVGCHFSIKRSILAASGLFEERLRGNALFEDADFSFRVAKAGGEIRYHPEPAVHHFASPSGGCRTDERITNLLNRIHNHALFYSRHMGILPTREFLSCMRNIAESLSRNADSSHSPILLARAAAAFIRGYGTGPMPVKARL